MFERTPSFARRTARTSLHSRPETTDRNGCPRRADDAGKRQCARQLSLEGLRNRHLRVLEGAIGLLVFDDLPVRGLRRHLCKCVELWRKRETNDSRIPGTLEA